MLSFSEFSRLDETYKNFTDIETKRKYADQVWEILVKSYEYIGGIKGSGFESAETMIEKIPYWKIAVKEEKVVAVALYKDKNGRKIVAYGSNGSLVGKKLVKRIILDDVTRDRTYGEVSDSVEKFIFKHFDESQLEKYLVPAEQAVKIVGGEVVDKYHYRRTLGNENHIKVMFGKLGHSFKS